MESDGDGFAGGGTSLNGSVHDSVVRGTFEVRLLLLWEIVRFRVVKVLI